MGDDVPCIARHVVEPALISPRFLYRNQRSTPVHEHRAPHGLTAHHRLLTREMKDDYYVWQPFSEAETKYYDKLFRVVDREKAGAIGGQAAVTFLTLSGLPTSQLQVQVLPSMAVTSRVCRVHPLASLHSPPRSVL